MKKEKLKTIGVFLLALLIGYTVLALVTLSVNKDISITGFVISNQTIVTEQHASIALGRARDIIEDMSKSGFSVVRVNDLLEEARRERVLGNYERVVIISDEIADLQQKAIDVKDQIKSVTLSIEEAKKSDLNAAEAKVLLNLSIVEFTLGNYWGAEELLLDSIEKLDINIEEEIKILIENFNILKNDSLKNNLNITRLENTISNIQNLETPDVKNINTLKQEFFNLNSSINILIEAKNDVTAMAEAGLGTTRVTDILNEVEFALELGYYKEIEGISENIRNLKLKAFEIEADIKKTKTKVEEARSYGLDVNELESLFNSSVNEFNLENYEDAEELLKQSFEKAEKIVSDSLLFGTVSKSQLKFNIINFLKRFWWAVLITVIITSFFSIVTFQRVSIMMLENRLKSLEREKVAIVSLTKKAQTAYFKEKSMGKSTYNLRIDGYQDRTIQIREKIPVVKANLTRKKEKAWKFLPFL